MADKTPAYNDNLGGPLTLQERAMNGGFTHKWTIPYTELNLESGTAADTVTIPLMSTGADWAALKAAVNVKTLFGASSVGDGAMTIAIGTKGNPDSIFDETLVSSAGVQLDVSGGTPPTATLADTYGSANTELVAQFATAAFAPGAYTQGEVDVFLTVVGFNNI